MNLESKLLNLKKYKYELHNKLYNNDQEITKVSDEIIKIKKSIDNQELNNLECIKNLKDLLDESEINFILDGIDTSDYTECGKDRIMDLKEITNNILSLKRLYPSFKLVKLKLLMSEDKYPPNNYYKYTYFDKETGCNMTM